MSPFPPAWVALLTIALSVPPAGILPHPHPLSPEYGGEGSLTSIAHALEKWQRAVHTSLTRKRRGILWGLFACASGLCRDRAQARLTAPFSGYGEEGSNAGNFACSGPKKSDRDLLQGTWSVLSLETNGKERSAEDTEKLKLIVSGTNLTFKGELNNEEMTFQIDPAKKLKEIDLINKDKKIGTFQGIYQIDGDKLKICYGRKEKDRPDSFATKSGDKRVLIILVRDKP